MKRTIFFCDVKRVNFDLRSSDVATLRCAANPPTPTPSLLIISFRVSTSPIRSPRTKTGGYVVKLKTSFNPDRTRGLARTSVAVNFTLELVNRSSIISLHPQAGAVRGPLMNTITSSLAKSAFNSPALAEDDVSLPAAADDAGGCNESALGGHIPAKSPDSFISFTMSIPPINFPSQKSIGKVGQFTFSFSPCLTASFERMSKDPKSTFSSASTSSSIRLNLHRG